MCENKDKDEEVIEKIINSIFARFNAGTDEKNKIYEEGRKLYLEALSKIDYSKYEIDPENFQKLLIVAEFFENLAKENEADFLPVDLCPSYVHGGITIITDWVNMTGEELEDFSEILKLCWSFSVTAKTDGRFEITVTIKDVYRKKSF